MIPKNGAHDRCAGSGADAVLKVLIPRELRPAERRVAATPETVKTCVAAGMAVQVEAGAGEQAGFADSAYAEVGATVLASAEQAWAAADVVLSVAPPEAEQLAQLKTGALLVGLLEPYNADERLQLLSQRGVSAVSMELLPRISRAQSMDVLSSQANIAGYKAVLLAASALNRYVPMLMTAAGTIQPARALVLGAGVAGLQAVATARRLGAIVYVSDVRPAAKEQVESLGGRFIDPPTEQERPAEAGGYAKAASEAFLAAQRQQLAEQLALADMVICTAQVPGKPAPRLISDAMVAGMKAGSVVVDLAVAQGGNCEGSVAGQTVERHGVQLIGADALPSSLAQHASALYARNLMALLQHLQGGDQSQLAIDPEDPILAGCLITHAGRCLRPDLLPEPAGSGSASADPSFTPA
ncbi:MAG: Re/Si-specific NAD(P)(+) transhydrogenase subunit alpha [Cyanobacteria bacterium K_Offshore_0m_m2_072]|nr:Re/Si-specific NAD(P)(+) transhydrogenase subunit alpha [Cyanobacteria bacterium K_Offshore_0m_m2_072]